MVCTRVLLSLYTRLLGLVGNLALLITLAVILREQYGEASLNMDTHLTYWPSCLVHNPLTSMISEKAQSLFVQLGNPLIETRRPMSDEAGKPA